MRLRAHLAVLQMRDAVKSVARLFPTAIISGRGREKVEGFVQLQELYYAGSHGMDIIGPRVCMLHGIGLCITQHRHHDTWHGQYGTIMLLPAVASRE